MRLPIRVADRTRDHQTREHQTRDHHSSDTAGPGQRQRPLTIAHRGASADAPENTLAAVRRAVAGGADLVEVDVQRTRDGVLVLMHDTTLTRTTDVRRQFPHRAPWRVADLTHAELARLDAGSWKDPRFAGERVPSLEDLLDVLATGDTGLLLELKAPELYPGVVGDVVAALASRRSWRDSALAAGRLVVESFHVAAMKEHKTLAPGVPVGLLGQPARANLPVLATWADQVNPGHRWIDPAYVDLVHRLGMECHVWTVNRRASMRRMLGLGVDGIITNHPEVLGELLGRRALPV